MPDQLVNAMRHSWPPFSKIGLHLVCALIILKPPPATLPTPLSSRGWVAVSGMAPAVGMAQRIVRFQSVIAVEVGFHTRHQTSYSSPPPPAHQTPRRKAPDSDIQGY